MANFTSDDITKNCCFLKDGERLKGVLGTLLELIIAVREFDIQIAAVLTFSSNWKKDQQVLTGVAEDVSFSISDIPHTHYDEHLGHLASNSV